MSEFKNKKEVAVAVVVDVEVPKEVPKVVRKSLLNLTVTPVSLSLAEPRRICLSPRI